MPGLERHLAPVRERGGRRSSDDPGPAQHLGADEVLGQEQPHSRRVVAGDQRPHRADHLRQRHALVVDVPVEFDMSSLTGAAQRSGNVMPATSHEHRESVSLGLEHDLLDVAEVLAVELERHRRVAADLDPVGVVEPEQRQPRAAGE